MTITASVKDLTITVFLGNCTAREEEQHETKTKKGGGGGGGGD